VGGCDESFRRPSTEDQELGFRYARQGGGIRFVAGAVVRHLHADTPRKYFLKKLRIGYFKAQVLGRHPGKAVSDSHTPPAVKVELLAALFTLVSPLILLTPLGVWPLVAAQAVFAASAAPLCTAAFLSSPRLGLAA